MSSLGLNNPATVSDETSFQNNDYRSKSSQRSESHQLSKRSVIRTKTIVSGDVMMHTSNNALHQDKAGTIVEPGININSVSGLECKTSISQMGLMVESENRPNDISTDLISTRTELLSAIRFELREVRIIVRPACSLCWAQAKYFDISAVHYVAEIALLISI